MIKASELRLGNLIERYRQQITVGWGTIRAASEGLDVGNPIPLTEEWLKRFGFENTGVSDAFPEGCYKHNDCEFKLDNYFTPAVSEREGDAIYLGKALKYVHQLQNLYFAMTGVELVWKEAVTS